MEELIEDIPLSDDEIFNSINTEIAENSESDCDEDIIAPLNVKTVGKILQTANELQNQILLHEPDTEKALKLNREISNLMSGYREQHHQLKNSTSQKLMTNYFEKTAETLPNKDCMNVPTLPTANVYVVLSSDEDLIGSSSDESDFAPIKKRIRTLPSSDSDNM